MLEKLRKKSILKTVPLVIFFCAAGILCIVLEFANVMALLKGHVAFETLEPEEIRDHIIVDASIDVNFGAFLEEYEKNTKTNVTRTTNLYYIIWTGSEESENFGYMGIRVPPSDEKKMEAMADATYEGIYSEPIQYSGVISKMDEEEYGYFKKYLEESGWSAEEIEQYALPYYISAGTLTGGTAATAYIIAGLGAVSLLFGIGMLIHAMAGGKLKSFKKQLETIGLSESEAELEYNCSRLFDKSNDLRISNRLTFFTFAKPSVIANDKVVWVYLQTITHRTNGIKTGTTYELLFYTLNNSKAVHIAVSNENIGNEVLQYIQQIIPRAVIGYSDELHTLFQRDYQGFLQLEYYRSTTPEPSSSTPFI